MRAGHEEIFVTDFGGATFGCSAMNGTVLTDHVFRSDFNPAWCCRGKTQVLWFTTDHRPVGNPVFRTDDDLAFNHYIGPDNRIVPDANRTTDNGMRANLDIPANLCARANNGGEV